MALHRYSLTSLMRLEQMLFRTSVVAAQDRIASSVMLPKLSYTQHRYYRKFSRQPIEVRPGKEDAGKIHLNNYVDQTSQTVNKEVLEEANRIKRLTKLSDESKGTKSSAVKGSSQDLFQDYDDQEHCDHEEQLQKSSKEKKQVGFSNKKHLTGVDEEMRKALYKLKPEMFEKAPALYRKLLTNCSSTKLREANDLVLIEGPKLLQETTLSGLEPLALYCSRKNALLKIMPDAMPLDEKIERLSSYKIFTTPYKKLNTWSSVVKGQGLLGVYRLTDVAAAPRLQLQQEHNLKKQRWNPMAGVTVVLDSVREPGNIGAIIRTVAAVGATNITMIKGCCDPWEGKALRAGCGGHFSVNIFQDVLWESIYNYVAQYSSVYVADICNSDREPISEDIEHDDDDDFDEVVVDCYKRSDDRNRNLESKVDQQHHAKENEEIVYEVDEDGSELITDYSFNNMELLRKYEDVNLPVKDYNEIEYFSTKSSVDGGVVLVIGGETGLSSQAKKFTKDNIGQRVSIPLYNGINSLNTSVAGGVLLYQMRTQAFKFSQSNQQNRHSQESS